MSYLANLLVRILVRTRPQRWCPPAISLRLFRLSADGNSPAPPPGPNTRTDLSYAAGRDGLFDLVVPDGPGPHPLVLWVHGGGWYSGSKADVRRYLEQLAARGFVCAAVNYPRTPQARYPEARDAVNDALGHLLDRAEEFGLDPARVVVAGDSIGAHIAAELATLSPGQFRGALLACGTFDPTRLHDSDRFFAAALESTMWSLTRDRRWQRTSACAAMTVIDRVTADFPPTFITAGSLDPLTRWQSTPLAQRLTELGVAVDAYFPEEPTYHEFHRALGTPAADEAFERAVTFLERVTGNSH